MRSGHRGHAFGAQRVNVPVTKASSQELCHGHRWGGWTTSVTAAAPRQRDRAAPGTSSAAPGTSSAAPGTSSAAHLVPHILELHLQPCPLGPHRLQLALTHPDAPSITQQHPPAPMSTQGAEQAATEPKCRALSRKREGKEPTRVPAPTEHLDRGIRGSAHSLNHADARQERSKRAGSGGQH